MVVLYFAASLAWLQMEGLACVLEPPSRPSVCGACMLLCSCWGTCLPAAFELWSHLLIGRRTDTGTHVPFERLSLHAIVLLYYLGNVLIKILGLFSWQKELFSSLTKLVSLGLRQYDLFTFCCLSYYIIVFIRNTWKI